MRRLDWAEGEWLNPPVSVSPSAHTLEVETADQSDLWRVTSYGFIHDTGHGLLSPLRDGEAMELTFEADYQSEFDQAGILLWSDDEHWIKCGIEYADGVAGLGAVVTDKVSDWSTGPVPEWVGQAVTVRMSRQSDAVTIRARIADQPWRLVRLAPIDPSREWRAGPYAASPSRARLRVIFRDWLSGEADSSLH
jgi:regulation of enolase protein 1 (concanavalin A-like superfamily)